MKKPTYQELEQRVEKLEKEALEGRRIEQELLKLYHAVNQSPSGIMITDSGGVIEYVNPKFVEITGYTAKEVTGTNAAELGEQEPEEKKQMWEAIRSGDEWRGEFYNKKKSGERYWERASISAIKNQEGLITHYVKVAEDMTELKHAQEALRESQRRVYEHEKRVEILKFANEMALTLMHELRNPLVSIGGFSKRISNGSYPDDKLTEYTRIIFEQARRLDKALNEVLVQLKGAAEQL
jgi:PAS domain S-box-containing protein